MSIDNRQLIERHMKAWSTGDVDGILACFTEDCVYEDRGVQLRFEGHDGVRAFAAAVLGAAPDFHWTETRTAVHGDQVWTEFQFRCTQTGDFPGIPATGKSVDISGVAIDDIRDGLIHRHRDYWNLAAYLQQVGLMPGLQS